MSIILLFLQRVKVTKKTLIKCPQLLDKEKWIIEIYWVAIIIKLANV